MAAHSTRVAAAHLQARTAEVAGIQRQAGTQVQRQAGNLAVLEVGTQVALAVGTLVALEVDMRAELNCFVRRLKKVHALVGNYLAVGNQAAGRPLLLLRVSHNRRRTGPRPHQHRILDRRPFLDIG